jgi:hypothetical protein
MHIGLALSAISTVILALAVTTFIKVHRAELLSRVPEPDPQFMPGQLMPVGCYCDSQFTVNDTQYCTAQSEGGERLSLNVTRKTGLITRTTTPNFGLSIGELMLLWGEPSG